MIVGSYFHGYHSLMLQNVVYSTLLFLADVTNFFTFTALHLIIDITLFFNMKWKLCNIRCFTHLIVTCETRCKQNCVRNNSRYKIQVWLPRKKTLYLAWFGEKISVILMLQFIWFMTMQLYDVTNKAVCHTKESISLTSKLRSEIKEHVNSKVFTAVIAHTVILCLWHYVIL